MKVIEIIEAGLLANGFTGLVVPGVCGCIPGDLSPGDCLSGDCEAGYKRAHSQRPNEWIVSTKKENVTDAEIEQVIANCG